MRGEPFVQIALLHDAAQLVGLGRGISASMVWHLLSQVCGLWIRVLCQVLIWVCVHSDPFCPPGSWRLSFVVSV